MSKQHTSPCRECPWRRKAAPGWLGGRLSAEDWIAAVQSDAKIPCHLQRVMSGPKSKQCAGAAIFRANVCKSPRDETALRLPRNAIDVFCMPKEFIDHHGSTDIAKVLAKVVDRRKKA